MRPRCLRVALLLVAATACSGSDGPGGSSLPDGLEQESHDVVYGLAGTDSLIPIDTPGTSELTLGILIANRSEERVRIEEFEIAESSGLRVTPELLVLSPRGDHQLGSEGRWPPERRWEPELERPFGPFELLPNDAPLGNGANVLLHVTFEAAFGYVKGYWVRGTQGGDDFEDFVDTFTAFCVGTEIPIGDCYDFANEHAFTPLGEPPDVSDTVPAVTATTAPPP